MASKQQLVAMNQHYKQYSLEYFLDAQERLGVSNIELWMSLQHFPVDSVSYGACQDLLKKARRRNLEIVAATFPSCDFQYQYGCQPREHRNKCISYFKNGISAACELGAKFVTCNSGWGYYSESYEEGIKATEEIIGQLAYYAETNGIIMVMETLTPDETNLISRSEALKAFIDKIGSPSLKVMIDTVAMQQSGETMEEMFQLFGADIRYMHFIDGGDSWEHLAWGDGTYPLQDMIDTIDRFGYTGYLSQELITESYLADPVGVDRRNFCSLNKVLK